jgi:hypothetical protein
MILLIKYNSNTLHIYNIKGVDRTVDSIRTKIKRVLDSYYKASDRMRDTGAGLDGSQYTTFHEMIKNTVCKYYDELQPVLGDRPNVNTWFTNESTNVNFKSNEKKDKECDSSVESLFSLKSPMQEQTCSYARTQDSDSDDMITEIVVPKKVKNKRSIENGGKEKQTDYNSSDSSSDSIFSRTKSPSMSTSTKHSSTISTETTSTDESLKEPIASATIVSTGSPKKKKKIDNKKVLISPIEAKDIQRKLLQRHKKQIHEKNKNNKLIGFVKNEIEEKDFLMKSREFKSNIEKEKHMEMKRFQDTKILIEKKRCEIDEKRYRMEIDNSELNRERIIAQTKLDEQKRMLVKLEMFKLRQQLKREDPTVSEEYLNELFPIDK